MPEFSGRTLVVRVDDAPLDEFATLLADIGFLVDRGVRPIIVAPTRESARGFVRAMNRSGDIGVGLSGADAGCIPGVPPAGIGTIQTRLLQTLLGAGYVPVIEPFALGLGGSEIAVAADDVAGAIACATDATRAIFFHQLGGVVDPLTDGVVDELTPAEALALADDDAYPLDLRSAIKAAALGVRGGVEKAQIVDGRIAHAAIVELLTARHLGTQVTGSVFTGTV